MTFMQSLASNPSGSGIYGQPQQMDALGIVNQLRDRDEQDFEKRAQFMSDLSMKQDRLRCIYDQQDQAKQEARQPLMNTVLGQDPNAMTGYQKGELGVRQQQFGLDKQKLAQEGGLEQQKLAQQGKLGQQALDIRSAQEELNRQKSDQINAQKTADMQRKIDESNKKIELAQQALQQRTDNAEAQLQAHKDLSAAMEERHKLELEQKDAQFQVTSKQHQDTIDRLQSQLDQSKHTKTTIEINPDGTQRTTETSRGSAAETVRVVGKDGKTYEIPKDKLDDWNKNHQDQNPDEQNQEEVDNEPQ